MARESEARPRWATLHPDNWTVLEVAEWLDTVVEEYALGHQIKVALKDIFCDVDGRRLTAMTLENFLHLEPLHGTLLFSVFQNVAFAGPFGRGELLHPRTLSPVMEQQDHGCRTKQEQGHDPHLRQTGPQPHHRTRHGSFPCSTEDSTMEQQQQHQPQQQQTERKHKHPPTYKRSLSS